MRFFASLRMTDKVMLLSKTFSEQSPLIFSSDMINNKDCSKIFPSLPFCHLDDFSSKDLIFWFFEMTLLGRSLSSWGRKAEGSHVLMRFKRKETKTEDSSPAAEWLCRFLERSWLLTKYLLSNLFLNQITKLFIIFFCVNADGILRSFGKFYFVAIV